MIDPSMAPIIAAVPSFLAAVTAAIIGWLNHTKMEEVHILVNSSFSKLKDELTIAKALIANLQNQIIVLSKR